jgi:cytochrome P450
MQDLGEKPAQQVDPAQEAESLLARIIDPATDGHRYPLFERLRDIAPVHRASSGLLNGWYVISGYENCRSAMLATQAVQSSKSLESMNIRYDGVHDDMVRRWMAFRDDVTDHDRLRKLFFPYFTPRAVNEVRASVQNVIDDLLDGLTGRGPIDVFTEFCYALPSVVVAHMLGIPTEDMGNLQHVMEEQVAAMASVQDLDDAMLARKDQIASDLLAYFRKYLDARRADPQDDLITRTGLAAPAAGVSDIDLLSQYVFVLIAGHSTTADSIGNALVALDANREQLQLLLDGEVEMRRAADELIRYDSSIATMNRVFVEDYTVAGVTIPAGAQAIMMMQSAHRDPAKFDDPNRLDLTRQNAADAFPFGGGRYFCLGQALAKVEVEQALKSFLERYPNFRVIECEWQGNMVSHGPKRLIVDLGK